MFHMHGLGVGLHGTLFAGASAVLLDGFDPDDVIDTAGEHDATLFFGVPTMYHRLVECAARRRTRAAAVVCRRVGSVAAECARHRFRAATGRTVLERYGMTETVMLVSNPYEGERRAGSVGFPLPGVEVRFARDAARARRLAHRRNRRPCGARSLCGAQTSSAATGSGRRATSRPSPTGWFRTGDLATVASDGYITIVGRAKELIISGGFNVYPREVEEVLAAHPAIADVAVVGTPSGEWGEEVTAFVVVRSGHVAARSGSDSASSAKSNSRATSCRAAS